MVKDLFTGGGNQVSGRDATGFLGLALIGFGGMSLWLDLDPWHILWYVFAWFGYFLVLDAGLARWSSTGVVILHLRHLPMFLWSIPFWFFFELYNIRIQNWYYVFTFRSVPVAFLFSCLAFSTVLPACLLHGKIIRGTALFQDITFPRWRVKGLRMGLVIFGALCLTLPLVIPGNAYWMTWGALACLPEVLAYRVGSPSILRDLEEGKHRTLFSLILGGAWVGLLWEGLNFGARCKWIYTVPGLEDVKLFEMPLLGFLGFPALALNAYPTYGLIQHAWHAKAAKWSRPVLVGGGLMIVFWGFTEMDNHTVRSRRPLLEDIAGLTSKSVSDLIRMGVSSPELLVAVCRNDGASDLAARLGERTQPIDLACRYARLAVHKGMGTDRAHLLTRHGIANVKDLSLLTDPELKAQIVLAGEALRPPVTDAEVGVWFRAGRTGGPRR